MVRMHVVAQAWQLVWMWTMFARVGRFRRRIACRVCFVVIQACRSSLFVCAAFARFAVVGHELGVDFGAEVSRFFLAGPFELCLGACGV